ncbi:MAG: PAS domain S-box protein [Anaerolineae bacterium]|nr:PAS domain S-box protein [Anaerolineae bacterium]
MPPVLDWWKRFVQWIEPLRHRVIDPAQHQQARLLNYLLVVVFASLAFLMLWDSAGNGAAFVVVDFLVLAILYLLNRIGFYGTAALALSLLISAAAFTNTLVRLGVGSISAPEQTLMWITLAILVAYLLLPLRSMLVLIVANLIGIVVVPMIVKVSFFDTTPVFYFTVVIALLVLIASVWRDRYVKLLDEQASALTDSEARYRGLLEATSEAIVIHKDGIIRDVNPAIEDLLGYKPDELIGQNTFDFIEPASLPTARAVSETNSEDPYELLLRHKTGASIQAELRGKTQWYRGEMVRVISVRDITERKREEELLVEREKVQALQKFISDLSHDLRTPLSVINTSIYLIERLAKEPQRQQHQIDVLQSEAIHMQRLLEDLINMARLDKVDTGDFKVRRVSLNELVEQAIRDHQSTALRKKQTLACRCASDLPDVLLDPEQFKLALKHLILNGLNYTGEGGTVMVETSASDTHVIVQVRDTGMGIEPDKIRHIFEQFYRADPARGSGGGTGVGLSIARKIIEGHRGKIEVESEPGHGSVFRILLPKVRG